MPSQLTGINLGSLMETNKDIIKVVHVTFTGSAASINRKKSKGVLRVKADQNRHDLFRI